MEVPSSGLLLTKACWEAAGGFDESFDRHQDWEFVVRIGQICRSVPVEGCSFDKRACLRNTPSDPELFLRQRRHYLEKTKPYIEKYPPKTQRRIYAVHTGDIALIHLRKGKVPEGFSLIMRSPRPLVTLGYMASKVLTHLWYGVKGVRFTALK